MPAQNDSRLLDFSTTTTMSELPCSLSKLLYHYRDITNQFNFFSHAVLKMLSQPANNLIKWSCFQTLVASFKLQ